MDCPKERVLGQQQHEVNSTKNEGWTLAKAEEDGGQYGSVMPFTRVIMDVTRRPPWSRRKNSMPVRFLGQAALRRE
jgi:hypothetical protein